MNLPAASRVGTARDCKGLQVFLGVGVWLSRVEGLSHSTPSVRGW